MNTENLELKPVNSSFPNSFLTAEENRSPFIKNEADLTIKNPSLFKISIQKLLAIIEDAEKRTFSEEIDKLEPYGRIYNIFKFS